MRVRSTLRRPAALGKEIPEEGGAVVPRVQAHPALVAAASWLSATLPS